MEWYVVKKGNEHFAEKVVTLPYHNTKKKVLYKDLNGDILSLGEDKEWAEDWCRTKNEINRLL